MTWPWKTCRTSPDLACVRRRAIAVLLVLAVLLGSAAGALPARAAGGIDVQSNRALFTFSESLTFRLQVQSASPLAEAILFFGRVDTPLVRRVYPDLEPGTRVTLDYEESLVPGQFAPGTELRYWWWLRAEDGSTLETPQGRFTYEDDRFRWEVVAGERVDLYYYGRAEPNALNLSEAAEAALVRLEEEMGVPVDGRVSVYAYASARDMALALSQRSESYDDRVLTLGVAVDEYTLLLLADHRDAALTLAHELSHIVVGIATDNPFIGLPRWLDEGLAMYAEGTLPEANQQALDAAIRSDGLLSLRSMTSYSGLASKVDLYYGEVYSVVAYMLDEYGREKMRELLSVFAEGVRQDEALQRTYGLSLEQLEDGWRQSLGLEPSLRGERPSVGGCHA